MTAKVQYQKGGCYYCHIMLPKNQMYKENIKYKTGHRVGISRGQRKKSTRASYARYYRNRDIFACKSCWREHHEGWSARVTRESEEQERAKIARMSPLEREDYFKKKKKKKIWYWAFAIIFGLYLIGSSD